MALLHFGLPNPFRPLLLVRLGAATAAVVLAGFALLAPVGAHSSAPPGNNGTVKVDGEEFDKLHDNDPHVSCTFWIQWYGFDEGTQTSSVTFQAWPPTGNGETLMDDEVSFSGHGSGNTLDFQKAYDLTAALATYTPHPKQGFHVKLTIHTTGSIGADTKHKVFWVGPCEQGTTGGSTPTPPTGGGGSTPTPPGGGVGGVGGTPTPPGGGVGGVGEVLPPGGGGAGGAVEAATGGPNVTPPNTAMAGDLAAAPNQDTWRWLLLAGAALLISLALTLPKGRPVRER